MYIPKIKNNFSFSKNIVSDNSIRNNGLKEMTDEEIANKVEEIFKNNLKDNSLNDSLNKVNNWLKSQKKENIYTINIGVSLGYISGVERILIDDKNYTIVDSMIKTFEVFDKSSNTDLNVYIYKKPEPYHKISINNYMIGKEPTDTLPYGKKEIPIKYIELAFKDIEKLAKLGYGDAKFLNEQFSGFPCTLSWPCESWDILPSGKLHSSADSFRKLGERDALTDIAFFNMKNFDKKQMQEFIEQRKKELAPDFVEKYLKAWKEEMIKINRMGIDRYRYEKYGRTH